MREEEFRPSRRVIAEPAGDANNAFLPPRRGKVDSAQNAAGQSYARMRSREETPPLGKRMYSTARPPDGQEATDPLCIQSKGRTPVPPDGVEHAWHKVKRSVVQRDPLPCASNVEESLCPEEPPHHQRRHYHGRCSQESMSESAWRPTKHIHAKSTSSDAMTEVLHASDLQDGYGAAPGVHDAPKPQQMQINVDDARYATEQSKDAAEKNKEGVCLDSIGALLHHPHPVEGRNLDGV